MMFSVLFTISSWLAAFSCFCLWLLEGSGLLSFHSQSQNTFFFFFSAQNICVKMAFHPLLSKIWALHLPWTGVAADQQYELPLLAGRMHPPLFMPLSFNLVKGRLEKTPLIHNYSLLGFCCSCLKTKQKKKQNKATQPCLGKHQKSNAGCLSISFPWSNTQRFACLLVSC